MNSRAAESTFDSGQGLGPHLAGKQIDLNGRSLSIHRQLGEGGFSFVFLVSDQQAGQSDDPNNNNRSESKLPHRGAPMVLKVTSVHNSAQRLMAEKEAKLLKTLKHPSIVQVFDDGFREDCNHGDDNNNNNNSSSNSNITNTHNQSLQHMILMEYCEAGTAFDAIKRMRNEQQQFDLPSLVIAFGQICNAVSYLHAQRPPVIHRDLKPVNFLIRHNNSYKLCDFGSAVLGHTDLRTPENRRRAEEVVSKTTTQMFRSPEMVDLYMAKKLTQSTDVWALGCCLYSLAFLRDCFEEGSNLAILSRKYKIPEDNPYGGGIVDLIDRMLTVDYRERADMSEVIMCLSALYSGRELPKRKRRKNTEMDKRATAAAADGAAAAVASGSFEGDKARDTADDTPRVGTYRTDGQGIRRYDEASPASREKKVLEAKKLNPNSAAAKRKKASETNKQKEAIFTPSHNTSAAGGGGKKSSASASTRSSTPISDSGDFNFASFDQAFDDSTSFEPFPDSNNADEEGADSSFHSAFGDSCQISTRKPLHPATESSFEVTFEGFDSSVPSAFSSDDHYFSNMNDGFGDLGDDTANTAAVTSSPSSKKFFGFGGTSNNGDAITSSNNKAKKKRGVFGMLKR